MQRLSIKRLLAGSIRRKILLTNAVVLILMIGASHLAIFMHWRGQFMSLAEDQGWGMAGVTSQRVILEFMEGDIPAIRLLFEMLAGHQTVRSARILDDNGLVLISSDPREERKASQALPLSVQKGEQDVIMPKRLGGGDQTLSFFVPIPRGPECRNCHYTVRTEMAVLQLDMAPKRLARILEVSSYQVVIVAALTILLLFFALLWLFRTEVNKPLSEIVAVMNRAKAGDLTIRAPVRGQDELGTIAENLNGMLEQLDGALEQVRSLHKQELDRQGRLASIGNLASAVAHEIKNPLAGIRGAMEVLEQGLSREDPNRELTREIVMEVDRINRMVRDLLAYSREPVPQTVPTELGAVVEEVLAQARQLPDASRIEILHRQTGSIPQVAVDYQLVKQAFFNVIQNAFDAMPQGGRLDVFTREEGDRAVVSFTDTGGGVDPNTAAKILQPFFTTRHKGTGLGLPIALSIVQAHGGDLRFESEPGRGANFTISFPALPKLEGTLL